MEKISLTSNRVRSASYDPETSSLTLDFGRGGAPEKNYRYLGVPHEVFAEIKRREQTQSLSNESVRESVGIYIGQAVTGAFKDAEIPFAHEKLDDGGNVIERSTKPIKRSIQ